MATILNSILFLPDDVTYCAEGYNYNGGFHLALFNKDFGKGDFDNREIEAIRKMAQLSNFNVGRTYLYKSIRLRRSSHPEAPVELLIIESPPAGSNGKTRKKEDLDKRLFGSLTNKPSGIYHYLEGDDSANELSDGRLSLFFPSESLAREYKESREDFPFSGLYRIETQKRRPSGAIGYYSVLCEVTKIPFKKEEVKLVRA